MNTNIARFFIVILLLYVAFSAIHGQNSVDKDYQFIYLVRHAEKANDATKDPPLNEIGKARAKKLSQILANSDIGQIYSTGYKRTRNTAKPLSEHINLIIQIYDPRDHAIIEKIKNSNGNMLIVGHSNTTPTLVNALLGREQYQQLDEMEYDKLFIMSKLGDVFGVAVLEF